MSNIVSIFSPERRKIEGIKNYYRNLGLDYYSPVKLTEERMLELKGDKRKIFEESKKAITYELIAIYELFEKGELKFKLSPNNELKVMLTENTARFFKQILQTISFKMGYNINMLVNINDISKEKLQKYYKTFIGGVSSYTLLINVGEILGTICPDGEICDEKEMEKVALEIIEKSRVFPQEKVNFIINSSPPQSYTSSSFYFQDLEDDYGNILGYEVYLVFEEQFVLKCQISKEEREIAIENFKNMKMEYKGGIAYLKEDKSLQNSGIISILGFADKKEFTLYKVNKDRLISLEGREGEPEEGKLILGIREILEEDDTSIVLEGDDLHVYENPNDFLVIAKTKDNTLLRCRVDYDLGIMEYSLVNNEVYNIIDNMYKTKLLDFHIPKKEDRKNNNHIILDDYYFEFDNFLKEKELYQIQENLVIRMDYYRFIVFLLNNFPKNTKYSIECNFLEDLETAVEKFRTVFENYLEGKAKEDDNI